MEGGVLNCELAQKENVSNKVKTLEDAAFGEDEYLSSRATSELIDARSPAHTTRFILERGNLEEYEEDGCVSHIPFPELSPISDRLVFELNYKGETLKSDMVVDEQGKWTFLGGEEWQEHDFAGSSVTLGFGAKENCITVAYNSKADQYTFSITAEKIKQIEEKYIPDTIARTADVEAVLDELHNYAQTIIGGDA